jgi:hypothetical protein
MNPHTDPELMRYADQREALEQMSDCLPAPLAYRWRRALDFEHMAYLRVSYHLDDDYFANIMFPQYFDPYYAAEGGFDFIPERVIDRWEVAAGFGDEK